jgi:hypothetical protein
MKNKILILSSLIILSYTGLSAYCLISKDTQYYGYELDLDFYYTYYEFYMPFKKQKPEQLEDIPEAHMYKMLFKRSVIPKFFLTELSVYPLPCLGVYTKKTHPEFYGRAKVTDNFNVIKSLCAGFEEPWAFSLLLGNLVVFRSPKTGQECKSKAYLGYLLSFGTYHIKDNVLVDDNWMEAEWKIKGERILPDRRMSWSFRIGGKCHGTESAVAHKKYKL